MRMIQLGITDLIVSRICFGCWQLSPKFWGEVPLEPWHAALLAALDEGVNFIDTADAYGDGHAETALGDFLAREKLRDRFVLATKFYWNLEGARRYPDTSHDYILRACEASLRRLKTDRIDLYQIHAWDPLTIPEEVGAALQRLRHEGKVRWFGVSNLKAEQMRLYRRCFPVHCLQPCYNMLTRGCEAAELPYCLDHRIGVIAYSPLERGLLTGKYAPGHQFTDSRKDHPMFQPEARQRTMAALDKLRPMADEQGLTLPQFAIRWVLTHPALTAAIVGIKTPEHVRSIVKAADDVLSGQMWHAAAGIMHKAG
ncbi:MAG: aldo/keto reductase [Kiritimatiellia bacterium]